VEKVLRAFSRYENLRFSRELRTRDRIHATEQAVDPQPAISVPAVAIVLEAAIVALAAFAAVHVPGAP